MTLTIHNNLQQRSPEWYAARAGIVTASVVGKLITPTLAVANNDTSRGITTTLVAERLTGHVEETPTTPDMWRGIEHEPYARDIYSGHHQQAVECGFMVLDSGDWSLGYSPDGLVADAGLIEVKCPRAKGHLNTILADSVPPVYMAQLQAALLVSTREWIDYVSFHPGLPLFVRRVFPDQKWFEAIADACRAFELRAAEMTADYKKAAKKFPQTERIDHEIRIA